MPSKVMDDAENAPMVLPNGHVYSAQSVKEIAARHGGVFVCPQTEERYDPQELCKAFIVC